MDNSFDGNLDRYTLGRMLGQPGGYGAAYAAEHEGGMQCVVKLFHGFGSAAPEELERLALVLARLKTVNCEQVVPVIDAGMDHRTVGPPQPWIAMPRLLGARSLDLVLRDQPRVDLRWAVKVIEQVALGLQAIHRAGLLHRDLKPANVLVDGAGRAWLIDFELMKVLGVTSRTPADQRLGTALWMAPEQNSGVVGPATDAWALGLLAHELLTGSQPVAVYAAGGLPEVQRAIGSAPLISPDVPVVYRELVGALLRKLPVARPDLRTVLAWIEDPTGISLEASPPAAEAGVRWSVGSREDIDAAELAPRDGFPFQAIDATVRAREDHPRLRCAALRLGLPHAHEPDEAAPVSGGPTDSLLDDGLVADPSEAAILRHLTATATASGHCLLPFDRVDTVGVESAVHKLRLGARHRDIAQGRPLIGTLHCSVELLQDPARALPLLAACSLVAIDGWRLWVDGLQPDCGTPVIQTVQQAAQALAASGRPVWVRSSGLSRWVFAATDGLGVAFRAGRGLWTRPRSGARQVPERVEIARLAGPIPRDVAERIAAWMPELVACPCRACEGKLPPQGARTVWHDLNVVGAQLAQRPSPRTVLQVLDDAAELRAELSGPVDWHGERDHLAAIRKVVSDQGEMAARPSPFLLAR